MKSDPGRASECDLSSRFSKFFARHVCLSTALGLLAILVFDASLLQAAVVEAWVQRYNSPSTNDDYAAAIAMDRSGNVIVTGYSHNGYRWNAHHIAKYAPADGELIWEHRRTIGPGMAFAITTAAAVDGSGDVVVAGWALSVNELFIELNSDFYVAKHAAAADGALLWEKRYNGPANSGDVAKAVAVDGSGNAVVTGYSSGSSSGSDDNTAYYYTAKYAAAGGALLWEKRGPPGHAETVALDASGNVVVTGYASDSGGYYTAKYAAADGALLWEKRGRGGDAEAIALDASGNVVVAGTGWFNGVNNDYYTAKYAAADGVLLWEKRYNGPANNDDRARAVAVDGSGDVVVTGESWNGSNFDYYTAKYAAVDGALLWDKRYNGPGNGNDQAYGVAVDGSGNVVVTGNSYASSSLADFYTAKYAAADGALLWERRYNGPANGNDEVATTRSLALGPNGIVAITGSSDGPLRTDNKHDYATVVYRDNLLPVITCPASTTANATGSAGAVVTFTVTATDDSGAPPTIVCVPLSGSLFPIGETTVTCTVTDGDGETNSCSFTVTVLGARGIKENVLAELIALRATVTDRKDGRKLDEAIKHLSKSLAVGLWVDETHLERRQGNRVFYQEKLTVRKLCDLIKSGTSQIPEPVLHGFLDQIFQADHLLAAVAIGDAITAGVSSKKIAQAQRFLARGDAGVGDDKCYNGIRAYRHAWKRAAR